MGVGAIPQVLTPLDTRLLDEHANEGRGDWLLLAPFKYLSVVAGRLLVVPAGFHTDFSSVPNVPVAAEFFVGTARYAAVIHDWLYETAALPRATCDLVFREAGMVTGWSQPHMDAMYAAVRAFGGQYYDPHKQAGTPQAGGYSPSAPFGPGNI